ncbi:MAG: hypothetical protein A3H96_22065 [Acidobacteria bacterium RIFCSPLOWO2_02_FULL_67_36]|nr:MAG: hypothetical protein A3H96_22065 [Acidobacteria bacterium RIFCSPLOWO2_02_FULL_67_36]OFW19880.1 MAG: hypothetical protein A3G21_09660 [Acidobacteria bacterium RIFCSPLOWO2_12_FULL_66_21]
MAALAVVAASATFGLVPAALAQQPPDRLARGDAAGTIGWFNGNKSNLSGRSYNNWYTRAAYGAALVGWYWTDHHKTEIEFGASSAARLWTSLDAVDGIPAYGSAEYTFSTTRIAIAQQYQFLRNAWVHPHVAGGLDLTWERVTGHESAVYQYDRTNPQPRLLRDERDVPPRTDVHARPFAEAGLKAYVTPHAFFRSDLRFVGMRRLDEVILRCGFGVDF